MTEHAEVVRRRAVVHGLVQGVGYRWSCAQQADRSGVAGWVRNRPDGTVEMVLEGDGVGVQRVLDWAARGPRHARVDHVTVTTEDPEHLTGFDVTP
ncbi:acylphosphatase [Actinotalea sp. K2]|uniref:acylphosphatase n=1 Tax=Actinotalea sp. K2 TaxID=2939438 RepID=UPI00201735B5|nr:acylphosphatase [Actinotalea sp. K2]MCL3862462.1 acylphosphatase [Actinotalea sp. K2]